jgi:hypothetical protein
MSDPDQTPGDRKPDDAATPVGKAELDAFLLGIQIDANALRQAAAEASAERQDLVIDWSDPAPLDGVPDGVALTEQQLNATVPPGAGAITYTPPPGTRLPPGDHTLTASVAESDRFTGGSRSVVLQVRPIQVRILWTAPPAAAAVAGGLALGPDQLNATTEPDGVALRYTPPAGTRLAAGPHSLTASVADPARHAAAPVTVEFEVRRQPTDIVWTTPAEVGAQPGGFLLTDRQLNATVPDGAGPLAYTPAAGTRLPVGEHDLSVTAAESETHAAATRTVRLKVSQVPVTIVWPDPAAVNAVAGGFALTGTQLNATTRPEGVALVYQPAEGARLAADTHTLTATVADSVTYRAEPARVSFAVQRVTPAITWAPGAAVYVPGGLPLDDTHLNAVIPPGAGAPVYDPQAGTKLAAGTRTLQVSVAETETHTAATHSVSLTVAPATVTIAWAEPAAVAYVPGGAVVTEAMLNATTTPEGVALTYTPAKGARLPPGANVLTAAVTDTANHLPAQATVTLTVTPAPATIVWDAPEPQDWVPGGYVLGDRELDASITPGAGALVYTPAKGTALAPGPHRLKVSADATATHAAASLEVDFTVRKARPRITWATPAAVDYVDGGFVLTDVQLNAVSDPPGVALTYEPKLGDRLNAGEHVLKVRPTDAVTYAQTEVTVKLVVRKAAPEITWAEPAAIITGAALGGTQLNAVRVKGEVALVYDPPAGNIPAAGTARLKVSHPESANYRYGEAWVRLNVAPTADHRAGYEAQRGGGQFKTPVNPTVQSDWNDPGKTLKSDAQEIMSKLQDMTPDELVDYMNTKVDVGTNPGDYQLQPGSYPNHMWKLPNGLQIRYKPIGDTHTNPPPKTTPTPMFCVEVRDPAIAGFSANPGQIVAKISIGGELAPVGPAQTSGPGGDRKTGACGATHLLCRKTKIPQVIEARSPADIEVGTALTEALFDVRLQPGDGAISFTTPGGTDLAVGDGQTVRIEAAETLRHAAANKDIVVNVRKQKPRIAWRAPDDVAYVAGGFALGDAQLNAEVTPATAGPPGYTPAKGVLLNGGTHTLAAKVAATATREEANATVALTVTKARPAITWAKPADRPAVDGGHALSEAELNATVTPADAVLDYEPALGTVLPPGTHRLQVRVKASANHRAAAHEVGFTVTAQS